MDLSRLTDDIDTVSINYTSKFNIQRTPDWFMLKLQEEVGELTQSYLMLTKQARGKGIDSQQLQQNFDQELADTFCHILLLAKAHNVDIESQVKQKWLIHKK